MRFGVRPVAIVAPIAMALALAVSPAGAIDTPLTCPAGVTPDSPIRGHLPVDASFSDEQLARFALPYARMIHDAERSWRYTLEPFGFIRGEDSRAVLPYVGGGAVARAAVTGFYATTYFHCREKALVVVYRSFDFYDIRDYFSSLDRQLGDGESQVALDFFDAIRARYPDYDISIAGHSAAGGLASYVAAERNVPSVLFNPARNDAALRNDGSDQLIVVIEGDAISDPNATAPPGIVALVEPLTDRDEALKGTYLVIDPVQEPVIPLQLHWSGFLLTELEYLAAQ